MPSALCFDVLVYPFVLCVAVLKNNVNMMTFTCTTMHINAGQWVCSLIGLHNWIFGFGVCSVHSNMLKQNITINNAACFYFNLLFLIHRTQTE
jgi:hypothetical protein